jgi:hypothetical protein
MNYSDFIPDIEHDHPELGQQLRSFRTLEHILDWLKQEGYDLRKLDMVTQDEYCHDLFFPLRNSDKYLVFGMT